MSKTSKPSVACARMGVLVLLTVGCLLRPVFAVDTNAAPESDTKAAAAGTNNVQDFMASYLQIQEQLYKTQLAIEKNRQDAEAEANSNSIALDQRLQSMEKAIAAQRLEQLKSVDRSDRMVLIAAGSFAAIGLLVVLLAAFLQWTAVNRLAQAAASFADVRSSPALNAPSGALEQSNARFLALVERLEQRLNELESSTKMPRALTEGSAANGSTLSTGGELTAGQNSPVDAPGKVSAANLLLSKSQTLMKLDKPEAALACLDEALAADPNNADALVKKGAALERLQRYDEAIQYYDRAIAQDDSLTIAYLYKGGVYNRLERYGEALACYEQALKKPPKSGAVQPGAVGKPEVGVPA